MDASGYELRLCRTDDIGAVVELEVRWADENITYGQVAATVEQVQSWLGSYFWVGEHEGQIVGFISGSTHTSDGLAVIPAGERYLQIDELYVVPEHRNNGLGSMLVDRLIAEAESAGITRSLVYSATKDWQRIVRFYHQHGFKMWSIQLYR